MVLQIQLGLDLTIYYIEQTFMICSVTSRFHPHHSTKDRRSCHKDRLNLTKAVPSYGAGGGNCPPRETDFRVYLFIAASY